MQSQGKWGFLWILAPICAASLVLVWFLGQSILAAIAVAGFGYAGLRYHAQLRNVCRRLGTAVRKPEEPVKPVRAAPVDPHDTKGLVDQMLVQGRYTLLLRPQVAEHLDEEHYRRAYGALEAGMALVPDGEVVLGQRDDSSHDATQEESEPSVCTQRVIRVEHFFLDRFPVTNEQYAEFVAAGGYQQLNLWDESIWPAILDFVDSTGEPGPRFWRHGSWPTGMDRHPVVGVSWYEAMAYARWVGKRLPTDAEWVKAASWPVSMSSTQRAQRRYPWGDSMERHRANLWGSGPNMTVPVDDYSDGVSVGGVYQLIGNVWEWTRGDFRGFPGQNELILDQLMKSIRGGAFDTYFDNQATCHFQSGEAAIARKHNIGFRCALSACDLLLKRDAAPALASTQFDNVPAEEVQV